MSQQQNATAPNERPSIFQLAFPSILGNLLYAIVGMVQTKVVSTLGAQALAATGAGQRVFFALQAVLMAIGAGATALVARAWGAGDHTEASRVTMASLVLSSVFALALTVPGLLFARPVAAIFGLDDHTLDLAADYIRWLAAFNLAFAVNFIMSSALRATGDAWTPLVVGALVNVVNVPLLYMFVFGNWGAPAMGVAGAALASGLAFMIGMVVLLAFWFYGKLRVTHQRGGWFRRERLKRLLEIGYPAAVEQLIFQAGFFLFLTLIGRFYGTEAFAAYNIGVNLLNICMVVGFGFSIAGSTLTGQYLGANDPEGAVRSAWRATGLAALSMGALGLLVIGFANPLAAYFLGDDEITIRHTVEFTWLLGLMMPLMAIEFAIGGALRGAGDTRFPLVATFFGLIGMRCGLAAVFTWMGLPVVWVYGALIGDYVLKNAMLTMRFRSGRWKYIVRNEEFDFART